MRGAKHNLQTDSVRSSQRRLAHSPPLTLFPAHSLLRLPKLVSDWESFYRSAYFAINNCFSRDQISETRGHRGTCIEKYERAPWFYGYCPSYSVFDNAQSTVRPSTPSSQDDELTLFSQVLKNCAKKHGRTFSLVATSWSSVAQPNFYN